ncbi:MAG: hypothetical protein PHW69_08080 [Elusimicrobiaceae bacterium]|nr:hypothetical protein [Elusimicrobiaceae bacterium]
MKPLKFIVLAVILLAGFAGWRVCREKTAAWEAFAARYPAKKTMDPAGDMFAFASVTLKYSAGRQDERYPGCMTVIAAQDGLYMSPVWPGAASALMPYSEFDFSNGSGGAPAGTVRLAKGPALVLPEGVAAAMHDRLEAASRARAGAGSGGFTPID